MDVITDQNAAAPGTVKIAEVIAGGPADGLVLISPLKTKTPSKDLSKPDADCDVASPKDAWMKRRFGRWVAEAMADRGTAARAELPWTGVR